MNSIGTVQFDLLKGEVPDAAILKEDIERRGVDWHYIRKLGYRTPQFQLTSLYAATSLDDIRDKLQQQIALSDSPQTLELVKDDYNYREKDGWLLDVRNVEPVFQRRRGVVCTLRTNTFWELRTRWTVRFTPDLTHPRWTGIPAPVA